MALKTFEHVLILADDVDKTKDFYVDILGLEVGYRPDFPFKGYWLYLKDNKAACIHLAMRKQDTGQDYYIGKKDNINDAEFDHHMSLVDLGKFFRLNTNEFKKTK